MDSIPLHLSEPTDFRHLLVPRLLDTNKGTYGHVLVVGGTEGKSGAAEMAGLAALRAGAGLVTVASSASRLTVPELMTEHLPETWAALQLAADRKDVIAIGPGLTIPSRDRQEAVLIHEAIANAEAAMVIDADGLNALAQHPWHAHGRLRVLTPHPGEMSRLTGKPIPEIQSARLKIAQSFAAGHGAVVVLKGYRTVIAFPDGRTWINPTGSPALAKGGTGDVLTGIIAGFLAQYPEDTNAAIIAAVYLHGLAGRMAAAVLGERSLLATELLQFLPEAMRECTRIPDLL